MNQVTRNLIIWAVISALLVVLFTTFTQPSSPQGRLSYSEFIAKVDEGNIKSVVIQGQKVNGETVNSEQFQTYAPANDPSLVQRLIDKDVTVRVEPPEESPWYVTVLVSWLPMILLIGVWIFFMRQMQGGGGKAMSFGRSRARMITPENARVTFADVAGVDEAKEELQEVVDFLSDPKKFTRLGGRIPKGVLLVGPPGTGKTLLARAVAGEAGVPFFSISGSDFVEMFVGVGASRVRDLFVQGKKNAPCLIFIDEIDAVGRHRGAGMGGGHDEREQTLNQLLVEMDGFESNEGVILIAATNRPDVLDPALMRPGRFDRQVTVPTPDVKGRKRILEVHSRKTPLAKNVNLDIIARGTPGFSGADLENLVNEAALQAAKENKDALSMQDFEFAKDKLLMGKERRSMVMKESERYSTAIHEAGHALVAKLLPGSDPVHKISIIPRGRALGVTLSLPDEDRLSYSKTFLQGRLAMMLGGRAAEYVVFGELTSGARDDIDKATKTARSMVCELGMSDVIGPMAVGEGSHEVFLGREWSSQGRNYSEETARQVDAEVKATLEKAWAKAVSVIEGHREALQLITESLLEHETITGHEVDEILKSLNIEPAVTTPNYMEGGPAREIRKAEKAQKDSEFPPMGLDIEPGAEESFRLEPADDGHSSDAQRNDKQDRGTGTASGKQAPQNKE